MTDHPATGEPLPDPRERLHASHEWPNPYVALVPIGPSSVHLVRRNIQPPCARCGLSPFDGSRQECVA
jgi:hypothetical protein